MATITRTIGPISAYAIAVEEGYTGTKAEWASEIANASTNAQTASNAANTATSLVASLPDDFSAILADLAPAYSSESTYAVGDHVIQSGKIYRCVTDITTAGGSFADNSAYFVEVPNICKEISSNNKVIKALVDCASTKIEDSQLETVNNKYIDAEGNSVTNTDYHRSGSLALPDNARYIVITKSGYTTGCAISLYDAYEAPPTSEHFIGGVSVGAASGYVLDAPEAIVIDIGAVAETAGKTATHYVASCRKTATFEAWIIPDIGFEISELGTRITAAETAITQERVLTRKIMETTGQKISGESDDSSFWINETNTINEQGEAVYSSTYHRTTRLELTPWARYMIITNASEAAGTLSSGEGVSVAFYTSSDTGVSWADSFISAHTLSSDVASPNYVVVSIPDGSKAYAATCEATSGFEAYILRDESQMASVMNALLNGVTVPADASQITTVGTILATGAVQGVTTSMRSSRIAIPNKAKYMVITSTAAALGGASVAGINVGFYSGTNGDWASEFISGYAADADFASPTVAIVEVPEETESYAMACRSDYSFSAYFILDVGQIIEAATSTGSTFSCSPYYRNVNFGVPPVGHYEPTDTENYALFDADTTTTTFYSAVDALVTEYNSVLSEITDFPEDLSRVASDGSHALRAFHLQPIRPTVASSDIGQLTDAQLEARQDRIPKIILVGGIHGYEKNAVYEIYYFIRDMLKNWQYSPILDYIYHHTEIIWIPIANPFGFDTNYTMQTSSDYDPSTKGIYLNANKVNLNRNFHDDIWTRLTDGDGNYVIPDSYGYGEQPIQNYGGTEYDSEPETKFVEYIVTENADALMLIDCHTLGNLAASYLSFNDIRIDPSVDDDYFKILDRASLRSVQTCNDHFKYRTQLNNITVPNNFYTTCMGRIDIGKKCGNLKSWAAEVPKILAVTLETGNGINGVDQDQGANRLFSNLVGTACTEALGNLINSILCVYSRI